MKVSTRLVQASWGDPGKTDLSQSVEYHNISFTSSANSIPTPKVVIDGYTVNSTLNSPATLLLGTTLILVCRLSGIPHGQQTTYTWTCPNTPCQQTGYAGRKINNNIIAINITSTSDGGTYTCTVTAGGMNFSQQFKLEVLSGERGMLEMQRRTFTIVALYFTRTNTTHAQLWSTDSQRTSDH